MIWRLWSYCGETARRSIRPNFSVHPVGKTALDQKNHWHFFDGLNELYHCAKFGEDHTTRTGCRCLSLFFGLPRDEAGALFVKHGQGRRAPGPLGCAKFHLNRRRGYGNSAPKYQKFPLFGKESPGRGEPHNRFQNMVLCSFIRLSILHSCIDLDAVYDVCYGTICNAHFPYPSVGGATRFTKFLSKCCKA